LRVTGGRLGGRTLFSPPARSRDVRPTSDRARETLFSVLGDVSDLSVLDLFCGTGALAIEAISRGADSAVLVDRAPALARRNAEELGIANRCELVRADAVR
jgi:16S rRNA (guanine966-N2)-methyltransferase